MKTPKSKMKAFDEFYEKNGYRHKGDPRHAMNAEGTRPKKKEKTEMMYGGMGKKTKMGHGGMGKYKKPEMAHGGMANKKKHMYAGGGSVMDNLTPGQKKMVMAMARDNKKA